MADTVESQRLSQICTELEISADMARRFVADYLDLLDQRSARIDRALDALAPAPGTGTGATGGPSAQSQTLAAEDCVVALLSLDASSNMLGAYEVALLARRLRIEVQLGRSASIERYRDDLRRAVERARSQLIAI